MVVVEIACLVLVVALCWFFLRPGKKCRLPPGPTGVPVFGNTLQFDMRKLTTQMAEIGKDYGDAYTLNVYNDNIVIPNSYEFMKEIMTSPSYAELLSGRQATCLGKYLLKEDLIFQSYSKEWALSRKIASRGLKTYGTQMPELEEDLQNLMSRIQNEAGTSVDPCDYLIEFLNNSIMLLVTGQRVDQNKQLSDLLHQLDNELDYFASPRVIAFMNVFPWARHFPFGCGNMYRQFQEHMSSLKNVIFLKPKGDNIRSPCLLDLYLEEKEKGHVTEEVVLGALLELLAGGIGDTMCAMRLLFMILAARPDVQRKIQEEIDREIGSSRLPCAEDKQRMPYTQAVLIETLRLFTVEPLTISRCTMGDVEIRDYFLPKGTTVSYNMWNVHHDQTFWKNPWDFDPARFLDDDGNLISPTDEKRQRMIAFGLGKRQCIGEGVARLRVFMSCVTVLQKYTMLQDPENPLPDIDPRHFDVAIILDPPRHNVIFQTRVSPR